MPSRSISPTGLPRTSSLQCRGIPRCLLSRGALALPTSGRAIDVKQIGRELGVRYVLEGSLRKAGDRIRVTAQLIEAETANHIWAERYDRDLADIFAVQ